MDSSKFKVFSRKIGFLKDFAPLVVSLVIILAALIIIGLTPLLIGNKLKSEIQSKSLNNGKKLFGMKDVPARNQWLEEKKYQDQIADDANKVSCLFTGSSKRPLLSYGIFPEPKESSQFVFERFMKNYPMGIEDQLKQLNAGDCPTQAELAQLLSSHTGGATLGIGSFYYPGAGQSGDNAKKIEEALCLDRARNASVYATLSDFAGYNINFPENFEIRTMVNDCWFWQLGYWITEDVIQTVGLLNSGSSGVTVSPVKRIVKVSFDRPSQPYMAMGTLIGQTAGREKTSGTKPSYVVKEGEGLAETFTGRFSNEEYDVTHFYVMVIVKSDQVFRFMQELCSSKEHTFNGFSGEEPAQKFRRNQITVIESTIRPVIRDSEAHRLYRYGEDAVVELSLVCEYLFEVKGYSAVKPQPVTEARAARNTF